MSGWLLDTNVLSELRRHTPDPRVTEFIAAQPLNTLFVSTVTIAEIRFGIEQVSDVVRRGGLSDWLELDVRPKFSGRVLPISEDVMLKWRILVNEGRKMGHTYSQPDLIIAATALCYGLSIVTRNTEDFTRTKASILNPWHA